MAEPNAPPKKASMEIPYDSPQRSSERRGVGFISLKASVSINASLPEDASVSDHAPTSEDSSISDDSPPLSPKCRDIGSIPATASVSGKAPTPEDASESENASVSDNASDSEYAPFSVPTPNSEYASDKENIFEGEDSSILEDASVSDIASVEEDIADSDACTLDTPSIRSELLSEELPSYRRTKRIAAAPQRYEKEVQEFHELERQLERQTKEGVEVARPDTHTQVQESDEAFNAKIEAAREHCLGIIEREDEGYENVFERLKSLEGMLERRLREGKWRVELRDVKAG